MEAQRARARRSRGPAKCLRYADERSGIRNGDIILFQGESVVSHAIRVATGSTYSHAGLACWWRDRLMVLEAQSKGVTAAPLSRVVSLYDGRLELWTTDDELGRDQVMETAKLELGKKYALWGLVRGLRKVLVGVGLEPDPWKPPEKFICSQYVSYAWRAGGIDLALGSSDEFTTPEDIANAPQLRQVGRLSVDGLA